MQRFSARFCTRFVAIGAAAWMALAAAPACADIPLGPGDQVRVRVTGLNALDFEAPILGDGMVDLDWLGTFEAAGHTVDALEDKVQRATEGKIIKQYDREGAFYIVQLEQSDVHIARTAYAAVVVAGDVNTPGAIPFEPGLTVRDVIAMAGGAAPSLMSGMASVEPAEVLRWQSDYDAATRAYAQATAALWRINAEIAGEYGATQPDSADMAVTADVAQALIDEQARLMQLNRKNEDGERAYFVQAQDQAIVRIGILESQQEKLAEGLAADTEEEQRVKELVERGLTPGTRLSEVRRSTVLSATRLLELEESLARAKLDVTRLKREAEAYEETRLAALLTERQAGETALADSRRAMTLASRFLGGGTGMSGYEIIATIYRREAGGRNELAMEESSELMPGDTLEIQLASRSALMPGQ
jgi:polysaccharide biosynthesis/export protein